MRNGGKGKCVDDEANLGQTAKRLGRLATPGRPGFLLVPVLPSAWV